MLGVQPDVAMNKEGRHALLSKTPLAPAEVCPSAFSSRPSTRQAPPPPSQRRHVGNANVTTMHVVISLPSSCWQNQRSISQKNLSVGQQIAAPPLLDGQRPASHLRDHLISLIVDIFSTAVQIPRPRAQHGSVTWRHTIGARADLDLLSHRFALEAIGGCARQNATCTFTNAAAMPLLESPPLERSKHRIRTCLFLSGAATANTTSKNSGFTLAFLAHDNYTFWTRKLEEMWCAKKKMRDPCHATGIRRPPTCRSHCAKRSMFPNRDHSKSFFLCEHGRGNRDVSLLHRQCFPSDHGSLPACRADFPTNRPGSSVSY